jgi:hypothetical protein
MPEYVVTILSAYIVTAPNERDAGEAAYDVVTGADLAPAVNRPVRKRGDDITFPDGRILKAFNAELAVPVEEVVDRSEAEIMQKTAELVSEMLDHDAPFEVWTVKQESGVWWVRDHDQIPICSDSVRTEAMDVAEAIGNNQNRQFKIVMEKS